MATLFVASTQTIMIETLTDLAYNMGTKFALMMMERRVLRYIMKNPGRRLYIIDKATINSHHNWGSKFIVERLLQAGKIHIVPQGKANWPTYWAGPHPAGVYYHIPAGNG